MIDMIGTVFLFVATIPLVCSQSEQADHRDFQYNSVVDPTNGRYNFAYDTGHDNDIAHSLHMQYQDADGIVRGRYGYTDPRGKLRMVEYEAGPNGFVARGDVGPDLALHDLAPDPTASSGETRTALSSYRDTSGNDFDLDPAPVQMAGWDPEAAPIDQAQPDSTRSGNESGNDSSGFDRRNLATVNVTSKNALELYGPQLGFYNEGYPRIVYSLPGDGGRETDTSTDASNSEDRSSDPILENNSLNIFNIDVEPDDIRSSSSGPVRRSADDRSASLLQQETGHAPVQVTSSYSSSYRPSQIHDHNAEIRSRYAHDHAVEGRSRYTHDHDAERRSRYTHDHDAEKRSRYTHDHDAERRSRYNHDHDAERYRPAYYRRVNGRNYYYPRRIFYRDSHSTEPHEHYDNPVYRNYRDHQHSDIQLYGKSRNSAYPATARSSQLRYIPSDKYHDKYYYWTKD